MGTLGTYTQRYIRGRAERGEITKGTQSAFTVRLDSLAASFGARPIDRFGPRAIDGWLRTIGHLAPATRRAYVSTAKGFCRWMVATGAVKKNPMEEVNKVRKPRSIPRCLSVADVARLFASAPDVRASTVYALMIGMGLRCCEVANLQMGDYDRGGETMRIVGKFSNERLLPVPLWVSALVGQYLDATGAPAGPLVRSYLNPRRGVTARTVSVLVVGWMKAAGVKRHSYDGVSAHACRHTAASRVLDQCKDLRVVQALLGHSDLSSTSIYLSRADLPKLRAAMELPDYPAAA